MLDHRIEVVVESKGIAIVFPGQGAQKPGMGQDFFDRFPETKTIFEQASDAIGEDMAALCFQEDPRLDLTEFTQPAILTVEIAMLRALEAHFGLKGDLFAGHSLGEYSAMVAADVIPFEDAVKIVRKRGALMQEAVPAGVGSMAAVILPDIDSIGLDEIAKKHGAELANTNSLEQIVISGKKESVEATAGELNERFQEKGINVVFLSVSAPFHSSLMQGIEKEFQGFLTGFEKNFKKENATRVISNFTAGLHTADGMIENLVQQISGQVRWVENMRLIGSSSNSIYEIGPNRPLQKFFKTVGIEISSIINLRSAEKALGSKDS